MTMEDVMEVAAWLDSEFIKMGVPCAHIQASRMSTEAASVTVWAPAGNETIQKWARPRWERVGDPYGPVSLPRWPATWTTNGVEVRVVFTEDPRRSTADRLAGHMETGGL
jgi:hypothetical protein